MNPLRLSTVTSFDMTKPSIARIYDYWLGGKDNYEADRAAAEAIRKQRPDVAELAMENKKFLTHAIDYVAKQGVGQFLDVGSGLPTSPVLHDGEAPEWLASHQAARNVDPDAIVGYVDYDPVAVLHSEVLLAKGHGGVTAFQGDMRDAAGIIDTARLGGFRFSKPVCVIFGSVLHFVDHAEARRVVSDFAAELVPGSYVIISVGCDGDVPDDDGDFIDAYNERGGPRVYRQTRTAVPDLFTGLELVPPGITDAAVWHVAGEGARPTSAPTLLGGVARRS